MIKLRSFKALTFALALTMVTGYSAKAASYRVVSGDSLFTISKTFNTDVNTIMRDSSLSTAAIYPGQVLNVPAVKYTVKSGDTLYLISKRHGISLYSLRKANNYWSDSIYVGQTLLIPGSTYSQPAPSVSTVSNSVIPYTEADLDLLARLIHAEAQGQSFRAQVAVGAVVVNRVQSAAWPNTIKSVIYQVSNGYYQFSPVLNGYINYPASATARQAALDALRGVDPTNGAIFYFDDSTKNTWLWSKTVALRDGRMVFSY
jgi:spore germination cell wall hydrolase CwlJ-like protein